ncbi:MAG: hypothetical protein LUC43_03125, partial [Burkholderiales bacterium]|nr:hypothetical protein [Burkholderiales bacterium]
FNIEGLSVTKAQDSTNEKINVNLNNYTTPLCKITFTKDEGYKGDFNYQYLLEQYSNKLSQQSIDFLKLRLSDQQKSVPNPTITVSEEEKPKPIINVESKEEVLPKEIVITEDEPFDNLDKLIDEALENGQDIVVKSENAPVSPTKTTTIKNQDNVDWLIKAKPDLSLSPFGETKRILDGNNQIKRDQFAEQILGKVVVWRLPVKDIMKAKSFPFMREENVPDDLYYLYLWSTGGLRDLQLGIDDNESVSVQAYVTPINEAQKEYLNNLESGWITVKGLIKEKERLGSLILRPAILWDKKQDKPFDPNDF